jgi:hypothetical protein
MPRPALANVSTTALQAELQRRAAKLGKLLKLKEQVDKDIIELQALAGQFGKAVAAEAPVVKPVRKYRRRKAKVVKAVAKTVATAKGKVGQYAQTATEFILGLLAGGKVLTSKELQAAWTKAGRKGKVSKTLGELVADKKLARKKIRDHKGSNYVAGSVVAAKPMVKQTTAKKAKKTFTCPTCKKVYASGPMLGGHYKAEPTHRQK